MSCLSIFSAVHLWSFITLYCPLWKKNESAFFSRWHLCWLLKWCRRFLGISAGQHSHTRQIYTVRSRHTCGDLFFFFFWQSGLSFTASQSPNQTLQTEQSVVTDMAFFPDSSALLTRRLSESSGGTNASLSLFTCTARSGCFVRDSRLCQVALTSDRNDLSTR